MDALELFLEHLALLSQGKEKEAEELLQQLNDMGFQLVSVTTAEGVAAAFPLGMLDQPRPNPKVRATMPSDETDEVQAFAE